MDRPNLVGLLCFVAGLVLVSHYAQLQSDSIAATALGVGGTCLAGLGIIIVGRAS